ncbi:hypothetical protein VP14_033 [Vibrio phage VPMCC14]|nr:hypothetical protein VP14_033 [Vibrio phage VPMCC14]
MNTENYNLKSLSLQLLTPKKWTVLSCIPVKCLFDTISIDSDIIYNIKQFNTVDLYKDSTLRLIYDNHSIFMNFYFRDYTLPKRCVTPHKDLSERLYNYLKLSNKRVSKPKVKETVKHFVKHVSRLKFHKKYCIKYTRDNHNWCNKKKFNASFNYMKSLISMLECNGVVKNINGFIFGSDGNEDKISSLLIITPTFIDWCNSISSVDDEKSLPVRIEDCLLEPNVSVVEIRVRTNPNNRKEYKVVKPEPKDKLFYAQACYFVEKYNEVIANRIVEIDGYRVPELFFRRIFNSDMEHGARFYDRGEIQSKNATIRSTITIDKEETIEVDYSSLHYCLCAEKEGLNLKGKDPYKFDFEVEIDEDEIKEWKKKYNIHHKYDPVRNLKKVAVLAMFNAKDRSSATSAISKKIKDDFNYEDKSMRRFVGVKNVSVVKLIDGILEHNKEVEKYFNSGIGLHLQFLDSQMIEHCISRFMEIDEVCLPVHDSLIVKRSLGDFAQEVMEEAYLKVMGSKINCRVE